MSCPYIPHIPDKPVSPPSPMFSDRIPPSNWRYRESTRHFVASHLPRCSPLNKSTNRMLRYSRVSRRNHSARQKCQGGGGSTCCVNAVGQAYAIGVRACRVGELNFGSPKPVGTGRDDKRIFVPLAAKSFRIEPGLATWHWPGSGIFWSCKWGVSISKNLIF